MKTILRFAICSIFLLPLSIPVGAQNAPVIDMEARKASQETLRRHIEMRERRLAELTEEISTLANRTDTRIGELVTLLSGIRDSQQSRHNVSQIKAQAVQGLRRMIETYRRERREVAERLRTDRSRPMEALNRDIDLIDARIEKRVADIIELTRSIPTRENIDRIETTGYGSTNFWGGWYENTRVSEDWRQNRRDGVQVHPSAPRVDPGSGAIGPGSGAPPPHPGRQPQGSRTHPARPGNPKPRTHPCGRHSRTAPLPVDGTRHPHRSSQPNGVAQRSARPLQPAGQRPPGYRLGLLPKPFDCSTTPPRSATACTLCARISRLANVGLWKTTPPNCPRNPSNPSTRKQRRRNPMIFLL
jgi:hypothetical protein